jgi:hypothetical protein
MKLEIVRITDRGVPNKERLHLRVQADVSLGYYVVLDTVYTSPTSISNYPKHAYWFPSTSVQAGDHVVLYTGPGSDSSKKNPDGTTSYFYHWGLSTTLWADKSQCAVVLELANWQTSPAD